MKLINMSQAVRNRLNGSLQALKEINLGTSLFNLVMGTDEFKKVLTDQISALYPNVALTFVVGNTSCFLSHAGKTAFWGVGNTPQMWGFDGVDTYVRISGALKKITLVGSTDMQVL